VLLVFQLLLCLGLDRAAAETSGPGVVLEEVGKGSTLERAGLRTGDLVLAWERPVEPPAHPEGGGGEIRTVFDWSWVQAEQAPRGTVRLRGERGGAPMSFDVPRGVWDARVRPRMMVDLFALYTEGRQRIEAGDVEAGAALWSQLIQRAEPQDVPGLKPWLLLRTAEAWSKRRQGDKARSVLQAALAETQDARTRVVLWEALGESFQYANEMARAEAGFRSALEIGEAAGGESLQVAGTLSRLGNILRLQGRLDAAEQIESRGLEIRQRSAPDSLEAADSLHQLFLVASGRRDVEAMSGLLRRAQAIQERWPPDTLAMADTWSDLGLLERERYHTAEAAAAFERAVAILEQRAPESIQMATDLARLAAMVRTLGDADSAEELLRNALEIRQTLAPDSLGTAAILINLGLIAKERGELEEAAHCLRRALEIWGKASPEGQEVASSLTYLGMVARSRGDLAAAWDLDSRALALSERSPNRLLDASSLNALGDVAVARGDLVLALGFHQRALAIYERLVPGTIDEALTLQQIGRLDRRMGRRDQAAQRLNRAVEALESQVESLGGSQNFQATFRAGYEEIYRDAIDLELERGHAAEAFQLLERSRARSFLSLLSERDLDLSGELPAAVERSRRDNAAQYDQTLHKLVSWAPAAGEEAREALSHELSRLRQEREEIAVEIRKASPRLAALRQPQPLDLAAAREVLDPGTLALSYSVDKDRAVLFAVTREEGLRVQVLPVGEERLRQDVARFLEAARQPVPDAGAAGAAALSRSLYRTLIGPVEELVARSQRVLILPDGPLHRLPFGALLRDAGGRESYFVEWKPLHTALSLTVYGALRASRRELSPRGDAGAAQVVAFGDPHYPPQHPGDSAASQKSYLRSLTSFHWTPLPYTRRELERIAESYPAAHLYLGDDATEERVKAVARGARVLHFATHGYLDDRNPLDSALVLTIPEQLSPGRDNGLLQVWEIFESLRLDADLVVLSACDSALGRELSGEGLIGLTRAFQYAGARSVVATLWSVSDQATAELMARLHHHYAAGLSKDEALRQAQIELIRQPMRITTAEGRTVEIDASAPFFWAAFQLFGDWR
jgi:CHAT domain-containing protein/Tfp pilus assembly protein PilF